MKITRSLWQIIADPRITNGLLWIVFMGVAVITLAVGHWFPTVPFESEPYQVTTLDGEAAEQAAQERLATQWQMCADQNDWTSEWCVKFDSRGLDYGVIAGP